MHRNKIINFGGDDGGDDGSYDGGGDDQSPKLLFLYAKHKS
jgi:hypothetical protein